jgi:hypothetical protein
VPRFLFLDQPEQVYFPEHARADSRDLTDEFSDEDWGRVRRLYGFLHRVTEDLDGQMQIIVVGHARLDELEWFNDALVEDWKREGAGLVPREWFESIRE